MRNPQSILPPGFRFHPTDEELILHYLTNKVTSTPLPHSIIAEVDIYKFNPWDLPAKAASGENEWYFFSPRDRKYPNGARPNRSAASGYWKATGTDKIIAASSATAAAGGEGHNNIGVKKTLVFYEGRPPKGIKTNWIMHEYRLLDVLNQSNNHKPIKLKHSSMRLDNWVLCRIYRKANVFTPAATAATSDQEQEEENPFMQQGLSPSHNNSLQPQRSSSFSNLLDAIDYSILSRFLSDSQCDPAEFNPAPVINCGSQGQPFSNNCTTTATAAATSSYLIQKLPQLNPSVSIVGNSLKRPYSNAEVDMFQSSKKPINSCTFTNTTYISPTSLDL